MLTVHNFSYGLLTPVLAYLMSCMGSFLGLRCATRARAHQGQARAKWLLLAGVSIGTTGIWVMHFIAMLGFTIPGQTIDYNVPITILSMLVAVGIVCVGLLIVGFGGEGYRPLLLAGLITGIGVATMHYMGMASMRMMGRVTYNPLLFGLSVVIAVVAATACAVGRAAAARGPDHPGRRVDHGRRGQRDALHRHGRDADVPGWRTDRDGHGQCRRRDRREFPAPAYSRHQHRLVFADRDHRAVAERG